MGDIYRVRIADLGAARPSRAHLERVYLDDDSTFPKLANELGVELAPRARSWDGVLTALRGALSAGGVAAAVERLARTHLRYDPALIDRARADPTQLPVDVLRHFDRQLLAHRILEELFPGDVAPLEGTRLRLDVVQLLAEYPPVLPDEHTVVSFNVDSFCLRILCEATDGWSGGPGAPLALHFDRYRRGGWCDEDLGDARALEDLPGILWSVDLVGCEELVELRSRDTRDGPAPWWSEDPAARRSREQLATYDVIIHPRWVPSLPTAPFDSRAY